MPQNERFLEILFFSLDTLSEQGDKLPCSLASHTLQSPRERGSGNFAYIELELCCWNAIMDRFT